MIQQKFSWAKHYLKCRKVVSFCSLWLRTNCHLGVWFRLFVNAKANNLNAGNPVNISRILHQHSDHHHLIIDCRPTDPLRHPSMCQVSPQRHPNLEPNLEDNLFNGKTDKKNLPSLVFSSFVFSIFAVWHRFQRFNPEIDPCPEFVVFSFTKYKCL